MPSNRVPANPSRREDPLFSVRGRCALVTGSSHGLGLVFARALAERGCHVVLNGRNRERLQMAEDALHADGLPVSRACFDVTDEQAATSAVSLIESEHPIDILVNNAGITQRKTLEEFPLSSWREILDVNLTGAFVVAKAVVGGMFRRGAGKIVNICSLQSDLGRSTIAPYAASKGGLKMLTRAMSVDWARHNVQINAIGPGYFITEMTKPLADDPEFDAWVRRRTPSGRWGDPRELEGALILLCSHASDFMNGQLIYVDGGITAAI